MREVHVDFISHHTLTTGDWIRFTNMHNCMKMLNELLNNVTEHECFSVNHRVLYQIKHVICIMTL